MLSYVILGWVAYLIHVYVYILCIAHPICVCVWQWSDNLLSGSRWFDRWAMRYLETESMGYLGFWKQTLFLLILM